MTFWKGRPVETVKKVVASSWVGGGKNRQNAERFLVVQVA